MSGIFGRIELDGRPIDVDAFRGQFTRLRHFGPDASAHWVDGDTGIGQHLLFVSHHANFEELAGPSNSTVLVADAIIDNRREIGAKLALQPSVAASLSDSDLIRLCYAKWGEECFGHLIGSYAAAVVDRQRREIVLARDHVGTRPLFWALRGKSLVFSSSIEAIICDTRFEWPVCERSVAEYMAWPATPSSQPVYEHVRRAPPGSIVRINLHQVRETRWWIPQDYVGSKIGKGVDAAREAEGLLREIVSEQVATPYKVGAHLSGGIDSTIVALLGSRQLKQEGRNLGAAYSWAPAIDAQYPLTHPLDERRRILRIAETEGIPVGFGSSDAEDFLQFLARPFELEGRADLVDEIPIMRRAKNDGIRVLLSGWGGDEVFSAFGLGHFAELIKAGRWSRASQFAQRSGLQFNTPRSAARSIWRGLVLPSLPISVQKRISRAPNLFPHDSFASRSMIDRHGPEMRQICALPVFRSNLKANIVQSVMFDHVPMRMETWAAMSARYGFQYRYPLADRRLHEFLLGLSSEQLVLGNTPRGLSLAVLSGLTSEHPAKFDYANEMRRRQVRQSTWQALADKVRQGYFDLDCPWIDASQFRQALANPLPQTRPANAPLFLEVVTGARIFELFGRLRTQRS